MMNIIKFVLSSIAVASAVFVCVFTFCLCVYFFVCVFHSCCLFVCLFLGRQLPQLAALSSTTFRPLTPQHSSPSAQSSSYTEAVSLADRPGSTHKPPPSPAAADYRDPPTCWDDYADFPRSSVRQYPDDALFPKKTGLFFADCMSQKNKPPPND